MSKLEAFKQFMSALRGKIELTPELLAACSDENEKTQVRLIASMERMTIINRIAWCVVAAIFVLTTGWF